MVKVGQALADRQRNVPWATGPSQSELVINLLLLACRPEFVQVELKDCVVGIWQPDQPLLVWLLRDGFRPNLTTDPMPVTTRPRHRFEVDEQL